jgi:hypothetical protein
MLKLATVLDNPGEPPAETRYRDPNLLLELGYNGVVLYKTTGISGLSRPADVSDGEMRHWVEDQFDQITQTIQRMATAGLDVYLSYDVLSLARDRVLGDADALTCANRPDMLCPASEQALDASVESLAALLDRWPQLSGVVLRFGDNDAARLPYLIGNDIYMPHCPRCRQLGRADRIALVLNRFHHLLVTTRDKRLIARAWNLRPHGMHDSVDLCTRLRDNLPGGDQPEDDRFVLSFKFTETDFWRYQNWNAASLIFGNRPIVYELQCQREFEGKGGIPNWQVPLWRDGHPESASDQQNSGLAQATEKINFAGLWAWVRGGGWGGPFIKNETWIDANVVAVPQLADNPAESPERIGRDWITQRLGLADAKAVEAIWQVLKDSPRIIKDSFYIGPVAKLKDGPWHPNGGWIQDDAVDAKAAWRMIQQLPDSDLDQVVVEKQQAVDQLARNCKAMESAVTAKNRNVLDPMINTLHYAQSLTEALRDLLGGLIAYRRYLKSHDPALADRCQQRLNAAQSSWNHHTQRHGTLPGAATSFREEHFWELTQKILEELQAG